MINKEELATIKERLLEERTKLMAELKDPNVDFGNDVDAFDEETDEAEEFANRLSIYQTIKEHLSEVNAAIERIAHGEYGTCEECHKEISTDVLRADPESRLCKDCKHNK